MISTGKLSAVGFCSKGRELHLCDFTVFKDVYQVSAEISRQQHEDWCLILIHAKFLGQIITQNTGLGIIKVIKMSLIGLSLIGEENNLCLVGTLKGLTQTVSLIELLIAADTQGLGNDLLKITVLGQEDIDGIVLNLLTLVIFLNLVLIDDLRPALGGILLNDGFQFLDNQIAQFAFAGQNIFQTVDLIFQIRNFFQPLEDMFLVDVAQFDLCNEFSLNFVDTKPNHQVGDDFGIFLRVADNGDGTINVQQDLSQTLQQMKFCLFLLQVMVQLAADTLGTPSRPFF